MKLSKTLNNELSVSWPKGFFEMTPEELSKAYRGDDSHCFGVWDKERHTIILVLWKKYHPLAIKMTSRKKMVQKNEKMTRAVCCNNDYRLLNFFVREVAGNVEGGFCYSYSIGDIRQAVKTVLIQRKNYIYSISCYGRTENTQDDSRIFDEILNSATFSG